MSISALSDVAGRPLVDRFWPNPSGALGAVMRPAVLVLAGTGLLALSAKVNVPLPYVPMTLQTLVVLTLGAIYGWRLAVATVLIYLAQGAAGLPVFAGPVGGPGVLAGPTAGYLAGFLVAAFVTGWLTARGCERSITRLLTAMLLGHVAILAAGWVWLAFGMQLGPQRAWMVGVVPFLAGSLVKSALGVAIVMMARQLDRSRAAE